MRKQIFFSVGHSAAGVLVRTGHTPGRRGRLTAVGLLAVALAVRLLALGLLAVGLLSALLAVGLLAAAAISGVVVVALGTGAAVTTLAAAITALLLLAVTAAIAAAETALLTATAPTTTASTAAHAATTAAAPTHTASAAAPIASGSRIALGCGFADVDLDLAGDVDLLLGEQRFYGVFFLERDEAEALSLLFLPVHGHVELDDLSVTRERVADLVVGDFGLETSNEDLSWPRETSFRLDFFVVDRVLVGGGSEDIVNTGFFRKYNETEPSGVSREIVHFYGRRFYGSELGEVSPEFFFICCSGKAADEDFAVLGVVSCIV